MRIRLDQDTLLMVAIHLLPLLGVWLAGWDSDALLMLYWLESAVVGLWTVILIALSKPNPLTVFGGNEKQTATGPSLALFILFHAGFFMAIHLFFLHSAFGVANGPDDGPLPFSIPLAGVFMIRALATIDALRRGASPQRYVIGFYCRIVVMQFAIISGGFLMFLIGPGAMLITLIAVRLAFELWIPNVEDYVERIADSARTKSKG
jgi:hypothetical protein